MLMPNRKADLGFLSKEAGLFRANKQIMRPALLARGVNGTTSTELCRSMDHVPYMFAEETQTMSIFVSSSPAIVFHTCLI